MQKPGIPPARILEIKKWFRHTVQTLPRRQKNLPMNFPAKLFCRCSQPRHTWAQSSDTRLFIRHHVRTNKLYTVFFPYQVATEITVISLQITPPSRAIRPTEIIIETILVSIWPSYSRISIHFLHAFEVMRWISHVQLQIDSVGVFCLGSGPVFCVWFVFCCLLRCFRWRNASLAGGFAGRRFWCLWFPFCCYIDLLILRTFYPCTEFSLLTHM